MDSGPARDTAAMGNPRFALRHYLIALVLAAVLPTIAIVALAVWQAGNALRSAASSLLLDGAVTLSTAIERELGNNIGLLAGIAANLQFEGHSESEAGQAEEAVAPEELINRVLVIPGAVRRPHEAGMPVAGEDLPAHVLETVRSTRRPMISDLFQLSDGGGLRIAVVYPAPTRGDPARLLALMVTPEQLIQALRPQDARIQDILVAVTDGSGRIVARSVDAQRVVGRRAPNWDTLLAMGTNQGTFKARTAEGTPILFAFNKLRIAEGWSVVVGEPLSRFESRWRDPLRNLAGAGLLSVLFVLLACGWIARLILKPVRALVKHGQNISAGDPASNTSLVQASPIAEIDELRISLRDAEEALRHRAAAERAIARQLARSERRYRALAEVGALVFWQRAADARVISATGWTELTGRPEEEALGMGWMDRVHPDDRAVVIKVWNEAVANASPVDSEFRVLDAAGEWHWVRARGTPIPTDDGTGLEWTGVLEDVNERHQAQARIAHMAHHDALTGLANRVLFGERLERAVAGYDGTPATGVAVLCVDLDHFKEVNDTLGHAVGDQLLKAAAERLTACLRSDDIIARLGGDEFAIIQIGGEQPAAARTLATRLIETLTQPFDLGPHRVSVGTSIGITLLDHAAGQPDVLMQRADLALYHAKAQGRGQYSFFEPSMVMPRAASVG